MRHFFVTNKHERGNGVGVGACHGVKNENMTLHLKKEMKKHLNAKKWGILFLRNAKMSEVKKLISNQGKLVYQ